MQALRRVQFPPPSLLQRQAKLFQREEKTMQKIRVSELIEELVNSIAFYDGIIEKADGRQAEYKARRAEALRLLRWTGAEAEADSLTA